MRPHGNLGQSSASHRLENNRVRALQFLIGLNRLQYLRALSDRIVIGVNDANFHAQLAPHQFRGLRLFDLIIVVIRGKGNQETQFFHVYSTSPLWGTFLPYIQRPKYPMETLSGVSSIEIHTRRTSALRLIRFETFDGAGGISLLEKRPAEFESGHFIIGLRQHHLAQKGHGLLGVSLHEKCVTEMIPGDRIGRAKFQLGAKLSGRRFEIALTQVDEAHEKVRFGKPRIKLQSSFHLCEATRKVFLLRVDLSEEKVNGGIVRVLLEQPTEDSSGNLRLTRSNEGRTPGKEKPRIIRESLEKWTKNLCSFDEVVSQEIAESEKLADEVVTGEAASCRSRGGIASE